MFPLCIVKWTCLNLIINVVQNLKRKVCKKEKYSSNFSFFIFWQKIWVTLTGDLCIWSLSIVHSQSCITNFTFLISWNYNTKYDYFWCEPSLEQEESKLWNLLPYQPRYLMGGGSKYAKKAKFLKTFSKCYDVHEALYHKYEISYPWVRSSYPWLGEYML